MGDILPSSDCIILSALGCEQREREAISCCKVFLFHHSIALPQSHSSSQLMGSITLSFWRGGREIYPEQQQQRLPQPDDYSESAGSTSFFLFFIFFPLLCIPTLVALAPSWLQPSLNKSPASQEWDSSCCCLALIWCNDTHNAAHFRLPAVSQNSYFRRSWFMWGKRTVATSFRAVYSFFIVVCSGNTFLPALLASSNKPRQQPLFSFGHFTLGSR